MFQNHQTLQQYRASQTLNWLRRYEAERRRLAIKRYVNSYVESGRQLDPVAQIALDERS